MTDREVIVIKKRIEYIDIFRGIGILFMIMGHVGFGERFDHFIHAFHMPMFFFISGFLHKNTYLGFKEYLSKKFNSLILPYLSFGIIYYLIWLILFKNGNYLAPLEHLFFINTDGLPIAGALWFLTALFFTDLLVFIIDKTIQSRSIQLLVVVALSLLGCLETTIFNFRLPYALGAALVGVGLHFLGRLCRLKNKVIEAILNLNEIQLILLILVETYLIFLNGYINMRMGEYSNILLFWINSLVSCIVLLNISKIIQNKIYKKSFLDYFIDLDKCIGKNSISYVCLNQFIILILVKLMSKVFVTQSLVLLLFQRVLITILCVYIIYFLDSLIRKSYLKRLIGIK